MENAQQVQSSELSLGDYWQILKRNWILFAGVVMSVLIAGALFTVATDKEYEATTTVLVRTRETESLFPLAGSLEVRRSVAGEQSFLQSTSFLGSAAERSAPEATVRIESDEAADEQSLRNSISFIATAPSSESAAATATAWAEYYLSVRSELEFQELTNSEATLSESVRRLELQRTELLEPLDPINEALAESTDPVEIARLTSERLLALDLVETELSSLDSQIANLNSNLIDTQVQLDLLSGPSASSARLNLIAEPPGSPVRPKPVRNMALAVVAGLIVACGAVLLRDSLDSRVRTSGELEALTGLRTIAPVPKLNKKGRTPGVDEAYQRVLSELELAGAAGRPNKVMLVTSSREGEGKSTATAQIARLSAAGGSRTVVVEADLHRPKVAAELGLRPEDGLTNYLRGDLMLDEVIFQESMRDRLDVISGGYLEPGESPVDMLRSQGFEVLIEKLRGMYDRVIIDTPPVLAVVDAIDVGASCDVALMVVCSGLTPSSEVAEAVSLLNSARIPILGAALIGVSASTSSYHFEY